MIPISESPLNAKKMKLIYVVKYILTLINVDIGFFFFRKFHGTFFVLLKSVPSPKSEVLNSSGFFH